MKLHKHNKKISQKVNEVDPEIKTNNRGFCGLKVKANRRNVMSKLLCKNNLEIDY